MVAADVRVRLGEWGRGQKLSVDRLTGRQSWTLSNDLAVVLVLFMGGRCLDDGIAAASELLQISPKKAAEAIELLSRRSLIEVDGATSDSVRPGRDTWADKGWTAAYDHHAATWDYPFVDYDQDGWQEDRQRMASYNAEEADGSVWAHASCEQLTPSVPIPPATDALRRLDEAPPAIGWTGPLSVEPIATILSATFGRLPPHQGSRKPRRSSPSGGARHPVEGYLFNLTVTGLEAQTSHSRVRGLLNPIMVG